MNGNVRPRSTTVRAAVVTGRLYSLVTCSGGKSAEWKTTPAVVGLSHRFAVGRVSVTVSTGSEFNRLRPCSKAADW
jgi:hypothetical protein